MNTSAQGFIKMCIKNRILLPLILLLVFNSFFLAAQNNSEKGHAYVDDNGILKWEKTDEEVYGFGVNYSVPFAHAYRSAVRLNVDPKKAIDNDVYHFSRLGFDLYRIHVWDTEISDTLGNLIENEHLDVFDYLLYKLKQKNINYVITPIAFWGSGWPEPDPQTPGFSHRYGKDKCLTDPNCIEAQQNYLQQFLNHVNPYTGLAYKDDPNVIAFEISNEPHHRGEAEGVTAFVSKMVDAIKKTGTEKPVFYNISHAVHFADAYFKAGIQGGTFQWYPTGLGYQREIPGNLLPNVNDYKIPFENTIKKYGGAKLVYEFDAADVGRSYIYPAMARSFREAGIQIATHFAYDPTFLAYANTEYNTHYMNLSYTPQKALSLMISSEVFHQIPLNEDFGPYPHNTTFDDFIVDYHKDLAVYNTKEKFIYTNHTKIQPVNEKKLQKVAGYGNSPVVNYTGTGAYFLDKIDKGIWRLEVMPDAAWVDNPFGRNSPQKTVGVVNWEEQAIKINLEDLGNTFAVKGINNGNEHTSDVANSSFTVKPGTYILSKEGKKNSWSPEDPFGQYRLNDFYAPESTITKPWLKHDAPQNVSENSPLTIQVQFIAPEKPQQIQLIGYTESNSLTLELTRTEGYNFTTTIPAESLSHGYLHYYILVKMNEEEYFTYPAGKQGKPYDWDFYDQRMYKARVVPESYPIQLFEAATDTDLLVREWRNTLKLIPTENPDEAEYQVVLEKLFVPDNENLNAEPVYNYSIKHFVTDLTRKLDLSLMSELVFTGRSLNKNTSKIQLAFVLDDGSAFGNTIDLGPELKDYRLSLEDLKPVKTVILPRPYPTFLPYFLKHEIDSSFDINKIESIQISVGPGIPQDKLDKEHGFGIMRISLQ